MPCSLKWRRRSSSFTDILVIGRSNLRSSVSCHLRPLMLTQIGEKLPMIWTSPTLLRTTPVSRSRISTEMRP